METTIKRKLTISQVEFLFDFSQLNVRNYFTEDNVQNDPTMKYNYKLIIRHNENVDVRRLLNEELNKYENSYKIEIVEKLSRIIRVPATSKEDAIDKVKVKYKQEDIVLDSQDFSSFDINLIP